MTADLHKFLGEVAPIEGRMVAHGDVLKAARNR